MLFGPKIKKVYGEAVLTCPRCNVKMQKLKKQDVVLDVCKKCGGMWVDAGEMEALGRMAASYKKTGTVKKGGKRGKK